MNTFDQIRTDCFPASGNDDIHTNLVIGSKDPVKVKTGSEGNVGDLQRALNKLGGSPKLTDDGVFGTNTQKSLKSLGYSYPVTSAVFYKILNDAEKKSPSSDSFQLTEAQMRDLWKKSKDRFGGLNKKKGLSDDENFKRWMKRQSTIAGLKNFGKGLFQVGTDWLAQKQAGQTNDEGIPDEDAPVPTRMGEIWGMPAPVVYIGGAVLTGLLIWGIVALAKGGQKTVIVQQVPAVPTA